MTALNFKQLKLSECKQNLLPRPRDAHKGLFGHVLIMGGDYGKGGAVRLAAEGALRAGAGLVSVATRFEYAFSMVGACPELMCYGVQDPDDLNPLLESATIVVIGPGLGQNAWGEVLFKRVLNSSLPLVIDADALNLLARNIQNIQPRENWILTPHAGEAARLLKQTVVEIQQNRLSAIRALQKKFQGVVVLKGSGTLVLGSSNIPGICEAGNPGMATAGMGDVLAGVIAGLVAQGLSLESAANLGVCVHASAGDSAAKAGKVGLKASDLFNYIRQCLN